MSIGEAASPCPQIKIAEKTFTDFFSSFNKQSFSVLGGITTSPNWLEEKVWGKGKRNMVAVYSMKWKSHSNHPTHEKKEKIELSLCSVDRRWRSYVWKWHAFMYGWLISQRHCLVYFSLPLCLVDHRVNGEHSSGRWEWYPNECTENVRACLFSWYCSLKQCRHSFFLSSDKHRHVWLGCLIRIFFSWWFVHKDFRNRCLF